MKANKKIKKDEILFSKLTNEEKRISICRDVLSLIRAEKINVQTGIYCKIYENHKDDKDYDQEQLNVLINKKKVNCTVCAKGALFLGHVDKTNHLKLINANNYLDDHDVCSRIKGIFGQGNLDLVEIAFENYNDFYDSEDLEVNDYNSKQDVRARKASNFGNKYEDDNTERLVAILRNMIAHKGIFTP